MAFEYQDLNEAVRGKGNAGTRHRAIYGGAVMLMDGFVCRPWLNLRNGELTNLIRGDTEHELVDMNIGQLLFYLEEFVPWEIAA